MIPSMETAAQRDPKDVAENKDLAALAYVWILSVIVLLAKRGSPFVKFHARQGTALFVVSLIVWMVPFVGKLAEVLVLALCAVGFLNAAQGEWRELPIVGPLSRGSVSDLRHSWRDVVATCAALWSRVRGSAAQSATPTSDARDPAPAPQPSPAAPAVPETPVQPPPPETEVPPPQQP